MLWPKRNSYMEFDNEMVRPKKVTGLYISWPSLNDFEDI